MEVTIKPTLKQDTAYKILSDKTTKYLLFGGAAGGGKSWLGCEWLLTNCYFYPDTRWFIGREELKRLKDSTLITFFKVCSHHKIPKSDYSFNGQGNFIQFINGSRIDLLDLKFLPSDPMYERYGSIEYTGGWLEEAGEVNFHAFDTLKTRVGRYNNDKYGLLSKIFITCNPKKNWLYEVFYKPFKNNTLPLEYRFIQSLIDDNDYIDSQYKDNLVSIKDNVQKQRLLFGNWEYESDPSCLIEYDAIIDSFTNSVEEGNKYITCDVARFGSDSTVIILWDGLIAKEINKYEGNAIDTTVNILKQIASKNNVPYSNIIVDSDGVGGGVEDFMRGIKGFVNNSKALYNTVTFKEENYQNLKTQCYYKLAEYINNHKIRIETQDTLIRDKIVQELEQVKRKNIDSDGKLQIIDKDEIKEAIGRSPDISDALMMRMWFEYKPNEIANKNFIPNNSYIGYTNYAK